MAQYIDKAAVVAEIEKRIANNKKDIERASHKNLEEYFEGYEDALVLLKEKFLDTLEVKEKQPELYFYCKWCSAKYCSQKFENGGIMPLCSDCKRNPKNSPFKTEEITTWYAPSNGIKKCIDYIKKEQPNVELEAVKDSFHKEKPEIDFYNTDKRVQYDSIDGAIKAHAEIYSFNIESKLFYQLSKEQQELWRKEIEQAVISGGENGIELANDMRYKESHQEQQKPELEKDEIIDYTHHHYYYDKDFDGYGHSKFRPVFTREDLIDFAHHFYELGLNSKKEQIK